MGDAPQQSFMSEWIMKNREVIPQRKEDYNRNAYRRARFLARKAMEKESSVEASSNVAASSHLLRASSSTVAESVVDSSEENIIHTSRRRYQKIEKPFENGPGDFTLVPYDVTLLLHSDDDGRGEDEIQENKDDNENIQNFIVSDDFFMLENMISRSSSGRSLLDNITADLDGIGEDAISSSPTADPTAAALADSQQRTTNNLDDGLAPNFVVL